MSPAEKLDNHSGIIQSTINLASVMGTWEAIRVLGWTLHIIDLDVFDSLFMIGLVFLFVAIIALHIEHQQMSKKISDQLWRQAVRKVNAENSLPAKRIDARPKRRTDGYVYLLKCENDLYKIGHTNNPQSRVQTFKVELPFDVEYTHIIECHDRFAIERYFHEYFADKRIRGEWFNLDETDIEYFRAFIKV